MDASARGEAGLYQALADAEEQRDLVRFQALAALVAAAREAERRADATHRLELTLRLAG